MLTSSKKKTTSRKLTESRSESHTTFRVFLTSLSEAEVLNDPYVLVKIPPLWEQNNNTGPEINY